LPGGGEGLLYLREQAGAILSRLLNANARQAIQRFHEIRAGAAVHQKYRQAVSAQRLDGRQQPRLLHRIAGKNRRGDYDSVVHPFYSTGRRMPPILTQQTDICYSSYAQTFVY
jgi:hypothetical protein